MEEINYEAYMPKVPPKAVFDYIDENELLKNYNVLVYRKEWYLNPLSESKERMVLVKCSCCGKGFYTDAVEVGCGRYARAPYGVMIKTETLMSGDYTLCPACGAECRLIHVGEFSRVYNDILLKRIYPMHIAKIEGRAALVSWKVDLKVNKDARKEVSASPYEAYIFEDKRAVKLKGWYKFFSTITYMDHWEQKKSYFDEYGLADIFIPFKAKELEGTALENSKLDIYMKGKGKKYPVSYAYMYLKHNNVENIVMQGGGYLISQMIDDKSYTYGGFRGASVNAYKNDIQYKKKRPCEMLGLTKEEFKWVVKRKISAGALGLYKALKENGCNIAKEEIVAVEREGQYKVLELMKFNKNISKCLAYITKQRSRCQEEKSKIDFTMLKDYYLMLTNEKTVLDKDNLYPQNLQKAHDDAIKRIELSKGSKNKKEFKCRYKILKPLEFVDEETGLKIVPCKDEAELRIEGKILHHCVATYSEEHAKGKSNIFFIRKLEDKETPFFTLELKVKDGKYTVNQNRGKYNCDRTEIVIEFEKKWLEHIKKLEVNINGK